MDPSSKTLMLAVAGPLIVQAVGGIIVLIRFIAVLRTEVDILKSSAAEFKESIEALRDMVRDSACKATGSECAVEPVVLRKVEKMQ